jgi:hypothetical protein
MPVELTIVETTTELETTSVEVILESASAPGPAGVGVPAGGTDGQVLAKQSASDYDTDWEDPTGGGGGAPTDATYLVTTAHGDLTAEVVVGATPGGELGGTWAVPTVDATHSGSSHASVQAAAEATAAAALSAHAADTTSVHGITDTSALALTANVQPLDSDLTAIAALTTTAFGRALLELANAAALLAVTGVTATAAELNFVDGVTSAIQTQLDGKQPLDSDLTAIATLSTTAFGRSFLALADAAAARALIDLEPGTDIPSLATFNDHSARHENGGADEVSVAGLSGELADPQPTDAAHVDSGAAADGQVLKADGAGNAAWEDDETGGGGAFDPILAVFGAPDTEFEFETSSLTGLTALSPAVDVADADTTIPSHYYLQDNTVSFAAVGHYASGLTSPWTAITRLGHNVRNANMAVGLFMGEATPGAIEAIAFLVNAIAVFRYTNPTSFGSQLASMAINQDNPAYCLIRSNSSTSYDFFISFDGMTWVPLILARNPSLTISTVGMHLFAQDAGGCSASYEFLRIWNSAKTVPGF